MLQISIFILYLIPKWVRISRWQIRIQVQVQLYFTETCKQIQYMGQKSDTGNRQGSGGYQTTYMRWGKNKKKNRGWNVSTVNMICKFQFWQFLNLNITWLHTESQLEISMGLFKKKNPTKKDIIFVCTDIANFLTVRILVSSSIYQAFNVSPILTSLLRTVI